MRWVDREIRIIVSTRVIDSEGSRWVLLDAVKSDRVVVLMEGYSVDDIVEPTLGRKDKVDKVGRDINNTGIKW